ncbi:MAG: cytochrome ubiquinol oxidase subunit I [Thermoproteus sp.]
MNSAFLSFVLLGFFLEMHLVFVNVIIGATILTVLVRYLAYRHNDARLDALARDMFRLMVATDLFAGVWATILTVYMASAFPSMTAIFMKADFYPIAIALVGIVASIPLIAAYWHLWGRIGPRTHSALGIPLAASVLLVPIGFRYLFAELDYPQFMKPGFSPTDAFANPIYPPLIAHTIIGAVDVGAFILAAVLAARKNPDLYGVRLSLGVGLALLAPQAAAGGYYFAVLAKYDPYIAANIAGPLLGYDPPSGLFYPAFYTAVALAVALGLTATYAFYQATRGEAPRATAVAAGVLAEAVMILMEYVNDGARYPYMFVTGNGGIPAAQLVNRLIQMPPAAIYVALGSTLFFTALFSVAFYYAVVKRLLPED